MAQVGTRRAPVTVQDIERVLAVSSCFFKRHRDDEVDWPEKSTFYNLMKCGHLEELHIWAINVLIATVDSAQGKSGPVTSAWTEYVDKSIHVQKFPSAYVNSAYTMLDHVKQALTSKERRLLHDLLTDFYDRRDGADYYAIGTIIGPYRDKAQVKAFTLGKLHAVLERVAHLYGRG